MNVAIQRKNWPVRLLVLLLLLGAQSFSLVHALDHAPGVDNGTLCEVCSAGHGLDTGVTVAHVAPVTQSTQLFIACEPPTGLYKAENSNHSARAPPLNYEI